MNDLERGIDRLAGADMMPQPHGSGTMAPRIGRLHEAGNHRRTDPVRSGTPAQRLGRGTTLRRIDQRSRQPDRSKARDRHALVGTPGLERDGAWRQRFQPGRQVVDAGQVARDGTCLTARQDRHIQAILRDIDTDKDIVGSGLHRDLPLRDRASPAARATVQVHRSGS